MNKKKLSCLIKFFGEKRGIVANQNPEVGPITNHHLQTKIPPNQAATHCGPNPQTTVIHHNQKSF